MSKWPQRWGNKMWGGAHIIGLTRAILSIVVMAYAPVATAQTSAFQALLGDKEIPFPFSEFGAWLQDELGAENLSHAVIPYGRSLHRYTADPHFLASPRIVLGVTGKSRLQNKLFIGYQPASDEVEIISFDDSTGTFQFEVITDYVQDAQPELSHAPREVCTQCHQNEGPIFSRGLWGETNANPLISKLLALTNKSAHGFSVEQNTDMVAALDSAIEEANEALAMRQVWDSVCRQALVCKRALHASLQKVLFGRDALIEPEDSIADLVPAEISMASFRLENFDPIAALLEGKRDSQIIDYADETAGAMLPREARVYYTRPKGPKDVLSDLATRLRPVFSKPALDQVSSALSRCQGEPETRTLSLQNTDPVLQCSDGACSGRVTQDFLKFRTLHLDGERVAFANFMAKGSGYYEASTPLFLSDGRAVLSAEIAGNTLTFTLENRASELARAVAAIAPDRLQNSSPDAALEAVGDHLATNCAPVEG